VYAERIEPLLSKAQTEKVVVVTFCTTVEFLGGMASKAPLYDEEYLDFTTTMRKEAHEKNDYQWVR
jgi:hypothetical protein